MAVSPNDCLSPTTGPPSRVSKHIYVVKSVTWWQNLGQMRIDEQFPSRLRPSVIIRIVDYPPGRFLVEPTHWVALELRSHRRAIMIGGQKNWQEIVSLSSMSGLADPCFSHRSFPFTRWGILGIHCRARWTLPLEWLIGFNDVFTGNVALFDTSSNNFRTCLTCKF